jgi:hypothetical protein
MRSRARIVTGFDALFGVSVVEACLGFRPPTLCSGYRRKKQVLRVAQDDSFYFVAGAGAVLSAGLSFKV